MTGAWLAIGVPVSASANVITDRDEKAVAVVMPPGFVGVSQQVYTAQRTMGMIYVAMFDAVNSIARRYQPYLVQLPTDPATSKDAAAAAAAAAVLAAIDEKTAGAIKVTRDLSRVDPGPRIGESGWHQAWRSGCCQGVRGARKR
jgi:hypothetical protein